MTLPEASTAPDAIRSLACMVREGVVYGRGARMKALRKWYKPQLKKRFRQGSRSKVLFVPGGGMEEIRVRPGPATLNCVYPRPYGFVLPRTWMARFYERIEWPVRPKFLEHDRHPFRLFLEIQRGSLKIAINIHDGRHRWLGPTFKANLRGVKFPMIPPLAMGTYMVVDDAMSDLTLCRWLSVILAQRSMLTEDEEGCAVDQFFVAGSRNSSDTTVMLEAYRVVKDRFVQPIGGRPSFPTYLRQTHRKLAVRQLIDSRQSPPLDSEPLLDLKELRWSEPNLYRALLDRIAAGRVGTVEREDRVFVSQRVAELVDQERLKNAAARRPRRFPGRRAAWINQLVSQGERRASATRKLKRWINHLELSQEQIEASIQRGRAVGRRKA